LREKTKDRKRESTESGERERRKCVEEIERKIERGEGNSIEKNLI